MCYCTRYHFHEIVKIEDFDFNNILLNEKSYENILIYEVSNKNFIGAKLMRIIFDKVDIFDRFIRNYDGAI